MSAAATLAIDVRLFGRYRELAARSTVQVELVAGATVGQLAAELGRRFAGELPARPVIAVNHRPAGDDVLLEPGDEVALIPPVAGG